MKRSLFLAALATLASTSVFAQSSVTVYGRVNAGVENQKAGSGDSVWALQNSSSRIGFKGTEDLGGGMTAGFQLEHGFNVDTGAQSQSAFWARQSEVNIGSNTLGKIRLGNFFSDAYYAIADYVSLHNHDTGTSSDALYASFWRTSNKVAYRSPEFSGLSFGGAVSLGEGVAGRDRAYDLAVDYGAGPLHVGAGYEKDGKANQFAVSALYEMGAFIFGGYLQRDKNVFSPDLGATVDYGSRTNVRLVGMYTMGSGEFHVNFGRAGDYSKLANSSATQATVAYNHNLSKRTKVYTFFTKISDDGALYGGDFRSLAFGVRHNF